MSRTAGLLVVNRLAFLRQALLAGLASRRKAALELSDEEIFSRYRGFDGNAWPEECGAEFRLEDGLAAVSDLDKTLEVLSRKDPEGECDVIYLEAAEGRQRPEPPQLIWKRAGFDVGMYESEWSHFSVVLNDVVYGTEPSLRAYSSKLNEHLLFRSVETATELIAERERLVKRGADLEELSWCAPVAIFVR